MTQKHKELTFKVLYKDPTDVPGGASFGGAIQKLIQISEDLRDRDKDGYLDSSHGGGFLANIKQWDFAPYISTATTCSPFTGTVLGILFDPTYPKKDLEGDPYVPMYNGGKDKLPKPMWWAHNRDNQPIESIVNYGLGKQVKMTEMRRGDLLGIDWGGHGHAVFCWDVHLNADGEVDAFTMLGSHGAAQGEPYYGISIYGCEKLQVLGSLAKNKPKTGSLHKNEKYNGKIFVDLDEFVENSVWFGLPGVKVPNPKKPDPKAIDFDTFRVRPKKFSPSEGPSYWPQVKDIQVGRLHYNDKLIQPYCMKDGTATNKPASASSPKPADTPKPADVPGHAPAPIVVVTKPEVQKDPAATKKVAPKPAVQDKAKPLQWQVDVEHAMQEFFKAQWIEKDPGKSEDINDAASQAAIKDFQDKFHLKVDGDPGKNTRNMIAKQLPACHQQLLSEQLLVKLHAGGKISKDPGTPDGVNDADTRAAVEEFQDLQGLEPSGIPDADTLEMLKQVVAGHGPSPVKQGLNPTLLALYWLGNERSPGGTATLRLQSEDLKRGQELKVFLKNTDQGDEIESKVKLVANAEQSEVAIPLPADFGVGSTVFARATADIDGGKTLEISAAAPLYVRPAAPGGALEPFFKFHGMTGEGARERAYIYVGYKVAGKPDAWAAMGRLIMDVDGAPNCYHPNDLEVRTDYWAFDIMAHKGALDWKRNGGHPGNWFGVVTDTGQVTGTPLIQGANDPFPGFYVAATSLADASKRSSDPHRYVDARVIPYLAFPYQLYTEGGGGSRFERLTKGPTGRLGDFLTVVNPKADDAHRYAHAIFADVGGTDDAHFGEGSPALGALVHAWGVAEPALLYIVYPHSGADQGTIPTAEQIREKGEKLFNDWGGMAEANRVLSLMPK